VTASLDFSADTLLLGRRICGGSPMQDETNPKKPERKIKNSLLLGYDLRRNTPIYISLNQSHVILILGPRGSGKTWIERGAGNRLFDQGHNCFYASDIKNEMASNSFPVQEKFMDKLAPGESPKGYPFQAFYPQLLAAYKGKMPKGNKRIQLSFTDLELADFLNFFGVGDGDDTKRQILVTLFDKVRKKEAVSFDRLKIELDLLPFPMTTKQSILNTINNLEQYQVLGDEYPFSELTDALNNDSMASLNLFGFDEIDSSAGYPQLYVGLALRKIFREKKAKRLPRPLDVFIDEAQRFIPALGNPACKKDIMDIINEGRSAGISVWLATQNLGNIDERVASQARFILLPWTAQRPEYEPVLRACGLWTIDESRSAQWQHYWRNLPKYSWCLINMSSKEVKAFMPLAPLAMHTQETR